MLPFALYELLPYIYLGVGALGCAWFESELILIASVLIIVAGFIVIWMRIDYRRNLIQQSPGEVDYIHRSGVERRQDVNVTFPLVDSFGLVVETDRRVAERRPSDG